FYKIFQVIQLNIIGIKHNRLTKQSPFQETPENFFKSCGFILPTFHSIQSFSNPINYFRLINLSPINHPFNVVSQGGSISHCFSKRFNKELPIIQPRISHPKNMGKHSFMMEISPRLKKFSNLELIIK